MVSSSLGFSTNLGFWPVYSFGQIRVSSSLGFLIELGFWSLYSFGQIRVCSSLGFAEITVSASLGYVNAKLGFWPVYSFGQFRVFGKIRDLVSLQVRPD
jgi:hypothetical protein